MPRAGQRRTAGHRNPMPTLVVATDGAYRPLSEVTPWQSRIPNFASPRSPAAVFIRPRWCPTSAPRRRFPNGAISCKALDLIGLSLPYSLVIDHSILVQGFEARNFQTKGDLSFDGGLIFGEFRVVRSRINGSIFAEKALIQKLQVLDSEISRSLILRESTFLEPAIFDTVTLSGELSVRDSEFPYFLLQFSKVGGVLDLTGSQARCSYQLRKNEIGDLVAIGAGFGKSSPSAIQATNQKPAFEWNRPKHGPFAAAVFNRDIPQPESATRLGNKKSPMSVKDALEDMSCDYGYIASPSAFVVSDTNVKQRLCIQSFQWLTTSDEKEKSVLALNGITVGATALIDLMQGAGRAAAGVTGTRQLQILGLQTHSLIFNFGTNSSLSSFNRLYLNDLQFQQIYSSGRGKTLECGYYPNFSQPSGRKGSDGLDNLTEPLPLPEVDEVMSWLSTNELRTTQPFAAFVEVLQKNGEDTAAKRLRIARANTELTGKVDRLFRAAPTNVGPMPATTVFTSILDAISRFMTFVTDLVAVFFGCVLWLLADNGYRPEKVGWFVVGIILFSGLYFWFFIRVIAIQPEGKNKLLPVGVMFLFDRLLPAYHIREDHYKIARYMKWVTRTQDVTKEFHYFKVRFRVVEADAKSTERTEKLLGFIKFLGLVLAIFLVAALNALVNH